MRTTRSGLPLAVLVALALLAPTPVLAKEVPFLVGRVNDYANLIPEEVKSRLETKLAEAEKATGAQVAVLTIDSLQGDPLEDFSLKVAQTWKLGKKDVDNGVLLLIAKEDRKMRIEVGYGLEGKLTDLQSKRILDNVLRPHFRDGDFPGGIEGGVDAIIGTIQGKDVIPASAPAGGTTAQEMPLVGKLIGMGVFVLVIGTFSFIAVFTKGAGAWFLYFFLMPFYLLFPMFLITLLAGPVLFLIWLVAFPIVKFWLRKSPGGKSFLAAHPGLATFATSSGGSGGGWSSGGGGFSGGGGSFGGGGSSSSW